MNLSLAALVDKTAVPGLRRVFIPPFHHPQFSPWTKRYQPAARPCSELTTAYLSYCLADGVLYLEYRPMSSAFFSSRALRSCFSVAACIWHCYSTPPTHSAHRTPDRYTRDDLCRLSRIWRPSIHELIPSPSSLLGTLTGCTSVIRRSFSTWWPGPGRSLGRA